GVQLAAVVPPVRGRADQGQRAERIGGQALRQNEPAAESTETANVMVDGLRGDPAGKPIGECPDRGTRQAAFLEVAYSLETAPADSLADDSRIDAQQARSLAVAKPLLPLGQPGRSAVGAESIEPVICLGRVEVGQPSGAGCIEQR